MAAVLVATVLAHVMHGRSIAHFWLNLGSRIVTGFPPARMLFFGRGMRLPPVVHHGDILSKVKKYGMWQRHRVDRELAATLGDICEVSPCPAFLVWPPSLPASLQACFPRTLKNGPIQIVTDSVGGLHCSTCHTGSLTRTSPATTFADCMVPPIAFGASTEDPDLHPPV